MGFNSAFKGLSGLQVFIQRLFGSSFIALTSCNIRVCKFCSHRPSEGSAVEQDNHERHKYPCQRY